MADEKTEDKQDFEDKLRNGGDLDGDPSQATYALEDNEVGDFYAAGKEYRTYANETDKPIWTDEERKLLGLDKGEVKAEAKEAKDARVTDDPKVPNQPAPPAAPK